MKMIKTTYNKHNTTDIDYYRVEIGNSVKMFPYSEKHTIGKYIQKQWKDYTIAPAFIYGESDWNCRNILLFKYELIIQDMDDFEIMNKWN